MNRPQVRAIIACAMPEEIAPFLTAASDVNPAPQTRLQPASAVDTQQFFTATLADHPVALLCTGIGLLNAARGAMRALDVWDTPAYILAGTTGGLASEVEVGNIIAGTKTSYFDADATAFGYQLGQIPQMPARYFGDITPPTGARAGLVLSGNSFVMAEHAERVRDQFPGALAVDMETAAAAQLCYAAAQPWMSLRAVSDLCGPEAGQDFHMELDAAAELSCQAVSGWLQKLPRVN